jgi:predicted phosphoribosyltransferase
VAKALDADLDLLIVRKLPLPYNSEAGFGAIAEDGSTFIFDRAAHALPEATRKQIAERQQQEIQRRLNVLRQNRALSGIAGRTVILVDDGIAMGSTMRAAIKMCRRQAAKRLIVAVPVTGRRQKEEIGALVDDIVVLETPDNFRAVAQVYRQWRDVSDAEVLEIMKAWHKRER